MDGRDAHATVPSIPRAVFRAWLCQPRRLPCPLRQHLILLLLRELEMLLAEKAEPRPLRPVLAPRVAAAHVALGAPGSPGNPIAAGLRQRGRNSTGENLGEVFSKSVEWVRRTPGHISSLPGADVARNYGSSPIPFSSASSISFRMCSIFARFFGVGAQRILSSRCRVLLKDLL